MLIIAKFFFHFICAIGRFFRRIFQLIFGRRHDDSGAISTKTEPVTLEHIRIINDMENENHHRPYQSLSSLGKVPAPEWNSWGADDIFRQKKPTFNSSIDDKNEEHVDYFTDIAATIKKTPKIVVKKRVNDNEFSTNINHSRLQMMNEDPLDFQPGLSEWNDGESSGSNVIGGTWDDQDEFNGLSREASEALRETRRLEREKKLREHQQRKLEKEAMKHSGHKRESFKS